MQSKSARFVRPQRVLALGFLAAIAAGGLLLALPVCGAGGRSIGMLSALFTAASAVCVTGLSVVDAGTQLSYAGQVVLLLLIQLGGLGFMSFAAVIMAALGRRVSLRGRLLLRDSMNQTGLRGMVRLSLSFFLMALATETSGALLLMTHLIPLYGAGKGVWYSFFTAVSAFCNAGFDVFGGFRSLTDFQQEPWVLMTLAALILSGGLGFPVILECIQCRFCFRRLSLHAKLAVTVTAVLLVSGTLLTLLLEYSHALAALPFAHKVSCSLFQSVTLRTAGFSCVDQAALTEAGKLLACLWMFIGASPASTGGGIKTTTAASLVLLVRSVIRGQERNHVFGRELSPDIAGRAMTIALIGLSMVLVCACLMSVWEQGRGFEMIDILFEAVSAFSTTGLSSLGTPKLSAASKWLLMLLMYLGRVGPLTLAFSLAGRSERAAVPRVRYPEEKIMIG